MRERLRQLGGNMEIQSDGSGTAVTVAPNSSESNKRRTNKPRSRL